MGYYSWESSEIFGRANFHERSESPKSLGWKFTFLLSYRPFALLKTSFSFFPHNSHLSVDTFSWQSQSLKSFLITAHPQFPLCLLTPLVLAPCRQQAWACLCHSFLSGTWKAHRILPIPFSSNALSGLQMRSSDALAVHSAGKGRIYLPGW